MEIDVGIEIIKELHSTLSTSYAMRGSREYDFRYPKELEALDLAMQCMKLQEEQLSSSPSTVFELKKLLKINDLENRLVRCIESPVSIGDAIFVIRPTAHRKKERESVLRGIVYEIYQNAKGVYMKSDLQVRYSINSIGRTVFLTRKEAEERLHELQKKAGAKL